MVCDSPSASALWFTQRPKKAFAILFYLLYSYCESHGQLNSSLISFFFLRNNIKNLKKSLFNQNLFKLGKHQTKSG